MTKRKFYKVVRVDKKGQRHSWLTIGEFKIFYPVQEWVSAPVGQLYVFDSLLCVVLAVECVGVRGRALEVWEVEVSEDIFPVLECASWTADIKHWWEGAEVDVARCLQGTYCAYRVRLNKLVAKINSIASLNLRALLLGKES